MSNLFGSGLSGLLAARAGLDTVGHNIANVNTPGFSRQRVELVSREANGSGAGFIGAGVQITGIRRLYDGFLTTQLRGSTASSTALDTFQQVAGQVDDLLGSEAGGLGTAIQGFFSGVHGLADDPTSLPARQVVLSEGEALARRFQTLDQRLGQQRDAFDGRLRQVLSDINGNAAAIANINGRILVAEAKSGGLANDLRDSRDELIRQLAEKVGINVITQDDGALNIATGSGQALVVSTTASQLSLVGGNFDPGRSEVSFDPAGGGSGIVSEVLSGGELGGLLEFRKQVLDPAQNAIGRIALTISHALNVQHRLGTDLNGARGGDLFTNLDSSAAQVYSEQGNTGAPPAVLAVKLRDIGALTTSDYQLERQGASYTVKRLSDGVRTTLTGFPASSAVVDGLEISLSGGAIASGDQFLIQPTRSAARLMQFAVNTPNMLAAAAPVRAAAALGNAGDVAVSAPRVNSPEDALSVSVNASGKVDVLDTTSGATLATDLTYNAASGTSYAFNGLSFTLASGALAGDRFSLANTLPTVDPANTGSAAIGNVSVAASDPNLADTVTITFDNPPTTFQVSGTTTGSPTTGLVYAANQPISFNGFTLSLNGTPKAGDVVTVSAATGAVGDNRNALALAGLQIGTPMDSGSASFEDAYASEITRVGSLASQAETNATAQHAVQDQIVAARESTSGVNLDEEAANLLKNQQAYQASAQSIAVANEIFQTLLNAVGR